MNSFFDSFIKDKENEVPIAILPPDLIQEIPVIQIQSSLIIKSSDKKRPATLKSVVINSGDVKFEDICVNGEINVPDSTSSVISFKNCEISSKSDSIFATIYVKTGCTININECRFYNCSKSAVICGRGGILNISDSKFENICVSGVICLQESKVNINNCSFLNIERTSINSSPLSTIKIEKCAFEGKGHHTLMISKSKATLTDCTFNCLRHHAIKVVNGELKGERLLFEKIALSAIYSCKGSNISIDNSSFNNMQGNALLQDSSKLKIENCAFKNICGPVLTVFGSQSATLFTKSRVTNCRTHAFVCKDTSKPVFEQLSISNINGNCFMITNLSRAVIKQCVISKCKNYSFSVFNGARPLIENNRVLGSQFINIFAFANPFVSKNIVSLREEMEFLSVHDKGEGTFCSNVKILNNIQEKFTACKEVTEEEFNNLIKSMNSQKTTDYINECIKGKISLKRDPPICINCHKKNADVFLSPCGHLVVCKECSESLKMCPLCNLPISTRIDRNDVLESAEEKCMSEKCDETPNTICLPCGHVCSCFSCISEVDCPTKICPKCKKVITNSVPLYSF